MRCLLYVISFALLLSLSGCYYDSVENLYPSLSQCDTTNVTYTGSVLPILRDNCFSCHSNATFESSGSGNKFEDYPDLKVFIDNGKLYNSITHQSAFPMPLNAPKLETCKIVIIKKWIDAGALNN